MADTTYSATPGSGLNFRAVNFGPDIGAALVLYNSSGSAVTGWTITSGSIAVTTTTKTDVGQLVPIAGSASGWTITAAGSAAIPGKVTGAPGCTHVLVTVMTPCNYTLDGSTSGSVPGQGHPLATNDERVWTVTLAAAANFTAQSTSGSAYATPLKVV